MLSPSGDLDPLLVILTCSEVNNFSHSFPLYASFSSPSVILEMVAAAAPSVGLRAATDDVPPSGCQRTSSARSCCESGEKRLELLDGLEICEKDEVEELRSRVEEPEEKIVVIGVNADALVDGGRVPEGLEAAIGSDWA